MLEDSIKESIFRIELKTVLNNMTNSVDLPYGRQVMMTCADSADNPFKKSLEPPRPSS
jgi:hypothetical protein